MCRFSHTGPARFVDSERSFEKAAEGLFLAFFQERGAQAPFSELSVCWIDRAGGASVRKNKVRVLPMGDEDQAKNPRGFRLSVQPGGNETGRVVVVTLPTDAWKAFGIVHPDACRAVEESVTNQYPSVRENWDMPQIRAKMGVVRLKMSSGKEKILRDAIEVLKIASEEECGEVVRLQFLLVAHEALVPQWEAKFEETKRRVVLAKQKFEDLKKLHQECLDSLEQIKHFPETLRATMLEAATAKCAELDIERMGADIDYTAAMEAEHEEETLILDVKTVSAFALKRLKEIAEEVNLT